jgi:hypothetical protein
LFLERYKYLTILYNDQKNIEENIMINISYLLTQQNYIKTSFVDINDESCYSYIDFYYIYTIEQIHLSVTILYGIFLISLLMIILFINLISFFKFPFYKENKFIQIINKINIQPIYSRGVIP